MSTLSFFAKTRLLFIDDLLNNNETVTAQELKDTFGVSQTTITRDFALYKKLRPRNMAKCPKTNKYIKTGLFVPLEL